MASALVSHRSRERNAFGSDSGVAVQLYEFSFETGTLAALHCAHVGLLCTSLKSFRSSAGNAVSTRRPSRCRRSLAAAIAFSLGPPSFSPKSVTSLTDHGSTMVWRLPAFMAAH